MYRFSQAIAIENRSLLQGRHVTIEEEVPMVQVQDLVGAADLAVTSVSPTGRISCDLRRAPISNGCQRGEALVEADFSFFQWCLRLSLGRKSTWTYSHEALHIARADGVFFKSAVVHPVVGSGWANLRLHAVAH